ncbi:6579_t:CDS:2 [Dentiscutata erythropus]|uniref:6579_t:CDS:1 n=1 Tax=Dentiscutata erythropus TaxID=1348616 RepID=A0A9N8W1S0_9GLOM|nr:6579_t:CDS:2 [Dentiscutata erythropus]
MQLLIATWGINVGSIPAILIYGNDLETLGFTLIVCLYKGAVSKYIFIEKDWFWYYSCTIWCFSACLSVFSFAVDIEEPDYGTTASPLVCRPVESKLHIFTYLIVSAPLLLLSFVYTIGTIGLLWKRWKSFRKKENRFTVIGLGYGIRLSLCGVCFTVFLLCTCVPRLISYFKQQNDPNFDTTIYFIIYDYAFAIIQKTAVMFFKRCYYAPPENLTFKTSSYLRDDSFSRARPPTITSITELPSSDLPTSDLPTSGLQVPPKLTSITEEKVFEEDTQQNYEIV